MKNEHSATIFKDKVETKTFDASKYTPEQARQELLAEGFEILDFLVGGEPAKKAPVKTAAKKKTGKSK